MEDSTVIELFKVAMSEFEKEKAANSPDKLFTINQVAKRLGRSHATISKLVKNGLIHSTKDGLIPESAINDYLGK